MSKQEFAKAIAEQGRESMAVKQTKINTLFTAMNSYPLVILE
jgi:hypothetical protein